MSFTNTAPEFTSDLEDQVMKLNDVNKYLLPTIFDSEETDPSVIKIEISPNVGFASVIQSERSIEFTPTQFNEVGQRFFTITLSDG